MSTGLVEDNQDVVEDNKKGSRLKKAFRERSKTDQKAYVLPPTTKSQSKSRHKSKAATEPSKGTTKSKVEEQEKQLFQEIGRLDDADGTINKDDLYNEAVKKLPTSGYDAALEGANEKSRLAVKIKQLNTVKLDKVVVGAAIDKCGKENYAAALKWITEQIDEKKLRDGIGSLEDVANVDKEQLKNDVKNRAATQGADRSLAWAKLLLEANKPQGQVQKDFTELVFQDDGKKFAELLKELGDKGVAELHLAFGGRKGLPVVKSILKDICKERISGLKQLINALN